MTKQTINVGTSPNDNRGDSLRASFQKINANFTELYTALGLDVAPLNLGAFEFVGSTLSTTDSSAIVIDQAVTVSSNLTVGGDVLPSVALGGDLGSAARPWRSLYVSNNTIFLGGIALSVDAGGNLLVDGSLVTGGGGSSVTTSATAPADPSLGDLWYDTASGRTYVYYDASWVDASPVDGVGITSYNDLTNKPTLFSGSYNDLTNKPNIAGTYQFSVAADDSTQRVISTDEVVKFIGAGGITTSSDAEGAITITQNTGNIEFRNDTINDINGISITNASQTTASTASIAIPANGSDVVSIVNNAKTWGFDRDGALTIPGDIKSQGNINIDINLADSTLRRWQFGEDGDLILPAGGDIKSESAINIDINLSDSTLRRWTFGEDGSLMTPNDLQIYKGDGSVNYIESTIIGGLDIVSKGLAQFKTTWDPQGVVPTGYTQPLSRRTTTSADLFGYNIGVVAPDFANWNWRFTPDGNLEIPGDIKSNNNINIEINPGDSTLRRWQFGEDGVLTLPSVGKINNGAYDWTFGSNGSLTFPDSTVQTTAYPGVLVPANGDGVSGNANMVFYAGTDWYNTSKVTINPTLSMLTLNGNSGTGGITFPDATVQTTAWTGSVSDLRSEGDINIDINLSDSTLRRWTFGEDGDLTFPNGVLKIAGNTISNYVAGDMGGSGSQLEVSQSKTVITNGVTNSLGGNPSLTGQSLFEVSTNGILSSFQVINTLGEGESSLTGEYLTELDNLNFKIGQRITNDLGDGSEPLVAFNGWTFSTDAPGLTKTLTFPDSTVQTTAWTGIANALRSEGNINIEINLSDSTLRRWSFGEDGKLTFPDGANYAGQTVTMPTTTIGGNTNSFVWEFSDVALGSDRITLNWNLLASDTAGFYIGTTHSTTGKYLFLDGTDQSLSYIAGDGLFGGGKLIFGSSAGNNAGDANAIEIKATNGDVYLTSTESVKITVDAADSSARIWTFDPTGDLTLPSGGNISEGGGLTGGAIRLTPAGSANANQALLIYPTAGGGEGDHIHLTAGGGTTELYLGDDIHYVKLGKGAQYNGTIVIAATGWPNTVAGIVSSGNWSAVPLSNLATTGGTGTGLTVTVTQVAGVATAIAIVSSPMEGYTANDTITVTSGAATATFTISVLAPQWVFAPDGDLYLPPGNTIRNAMTGDDFLAGESTLVNGAYTVSLGADGTLTLPGSIVGTATQAVFNTTSTTVNAFGAATTALNIGASGAPITGFAATATTSSTASSLGYLGLPQSATATTATLAIGDAGKHIYVTTASQTITIPANASVAYPIGTTLTFIAGPSATTVLIAITSDTLRLAGSASTGQRTLAANGMATAVKVAATTWYINGVGLT